MRLTSNFFEGLALLRIKVVSHPKNPGKPLILLLNTGDNIGNEIGGDIPTPYGKMTKAAQSHLAKHMGFERDQFVSVTTAMESPPTNTGVLKMVRGLF